MHLDLLNFAILLFFGAGIIFACAPLIVAFFIAPKSKGGDIQLPYECGINPHGISRVRFGINYYFYALLFLAFDVDVLYLFPVASVYKQNSGWTVFGELSIFLGVLMLAVISFWRKGGFTWPRKISY